MKICGARPIECPTDSNRPYIPETYSEIERMKMGNVKSKGEKESGRHHRQCRDSQIGQHYYAEY
ncbi:hypothetical protein BLOT_004949 [Blomia tropicalis]|nr:hypothetical protein BLOT_004949 [Blomia tropicalis]